MVGGGRDCDTQCPTTASLHLLARLTLVPYQAGPAQSLSDKMRPHQCLPLLSVFVLMLSTKRASSSTTLSCFSVGLLDLPTFGFNQEKQEEAEAKSEVTIMVEP